MDATQLTVLTPEEGAQIGARDSVNKAWLPFKVIMVTKKYVVCLSPLNPGTRFSFRIGESGWMWQPWKDCPALRMKCPRCKGTGWTRDKKDETQTLDCGTCLTTGEVERDDPFTTPH